MKVIAVLFLLGCLVGLIMKLTGHGGDCETITTDAGPQTICQSDYSPTP